MELRPNFRGIFSILALCTVISFALVIAEGCRPPVDDCVPDQRRCNAAGVPQICVGSTRGENTRWTNADRPCGELTHPSGQPVVCCWNLSRYANMRLQSCVPQNLCISTDSGVGD